MQVQTPSNAPFQTPVQSQGNTNFKQAAAFINISLPNESGERGKKLGSIRLMGDDADHVALINALQENPEAVSALLSNLVVDFRMNEKKTEASIDVAALLKAKK